MATCGRTGAASSGAGWAAGGGGWWSATGAAVLDRRSGSVAVALLGSRLPRPRPGSRLVLSGGARRAPGVIDSRHGQARRAVIGRGVERRRAPASDAGDGAGEVTRS